MVWRVRALDYIGDMLTFYFINESEIDERLSNWGIEEFDRELVPAYFADFLEDEEEQENEN